MTGLGVAWLVSSAVVTPDLAGQALTAANLPAYRSAIVPGAHELAWLDVEWRRSFERGLLDAQELGRPVLLWTMNGHPMGAT